MHEYSGRDLKQLFDLPASMLRSLVRAGHLHPRGRGRSARYSFDDLLTLKTAAALRAAKIPSRKIHGALRKLREILPPEMRLNAVALSSIGNAITARHGDAARWEVDTGQYALPLEPAPKSWAVQRLKDSNPAHSPRDLAHLHFERAYSVEEQDPAAARIAYLRCLALDAGHIEARINLGRLLHIGGELQEAERVYRTGCHSSALLLFNLAVLLEDTHRDSDAIQCYRDALALDPTLPDAHFNLARLHESRGSTQDAFRSLLAYRRLVNAPLRPGPSSVRR
jgi:tetratricopeptide (TPR) repeat protein